MPIDKDALQSQAQSLFDKMIDQIRTLVECESPTEDAAAVNSAMDLAAQFAVELGGTVVRYPQMGFGDVVELWFGAEKQGQPLMLLGHLDTVWPAGTLERMPYRKEIDSQGRTRLHGPGVLDMKSGVVMALTAIHLLQSGAGLPCPIVLLLTPDEEVGSTASRHHTEKLASTCRSVFVLEPAQGLPESKTQAAYKTARKGVGRYQLHVHGIAAHSGVDFANGHSATLELSRLLLEIATWTDQNIGRTLNPGIIEGGTRSNVVAAHAWAEIDVRASTTMDAKKIESLFQSLHVTDTACTLEISGGITRPPMERTPAIASLFQRSQKLAAELGFDLREAMTGGGSDGNFTAALGIPTLDGMGAVGEGAHADHESILLDQLIPRTVLLCCVLASFHQQPSVQV